MPPLPAEPVTDENCRLKKLHNNPKMLGLHIETKWC
jgi:hypothetical protein